MQNTPTYKGNVGNLVQHWTLCALLNIAQQQGVRGLNFIDAHAMAPIAYKCTETNQQRRCPFDHVRANLLSQRSVYERAWRQIAPAQGYPNSANFVQRVWQGKFSMLLCEKEPETVAALKKWLPSVQAQPRCKRAKVVCGDWRKRFGQLLPPPDEVGLPSEALTLISFDPNTYSARNTYPGRNPTKPGRRERPNLYQPDLQRTLDALANVSSRVIIQLSAYKTRPPETQQDRVICSVNSVLCPEGLEQAARVRKDGNMMSLVYARGLDDEWLRKLRELPRHFTAWFNLATAN